MVTRILVLGPSSLVGSHFIQTFGNKYEISALGRRTNIFEGTDLIVGFQAVDVQNEAKLQDAIKRSEAEYVINYAAETNVDKCEEQKGLTDGSVYLTNTCAARRVAEACKETRKTFCQISTDFIFDGTQGPYSETDRAGPIAKEISWYGYTKYVAEKEMMSVATTDFCILRISYPYRANFEHKKDFARNILDLYQNGKLYPLFTDQIFSPTLIDDVSRCLDFLIERNARGIYHIASRYPTTPFDFARELISTFLSKVPASALKKASIIEFNNTRSKAPRPVLGGLKTDKIVREGFIPKTFEEGILEIFVQSKEKIPQ